ncbi:MAG TPA: hypothetical protein VII66_01320 [Gemmatimonadaceae bacterium]
MLRPTSLVRRTSRWGWRLGTLLAILAQGWIAVAPLSESRGFGLSAHVEAAGNHRGHFTHDEASCAACSVLSLHVLASHPAAVPIPPGQPRVGRVAAREAWIAPPRVRTSQPRAPPSFV